jgi:hypothetical protein
MTKQEHARVVTDAENSLSPYVIKRGDEELVRFADQKLAERFAKLLNTDIPQS